MNCNPSELTLSLRDPYRLTTSEIKSDYTDDDLWEQYLYKKYTDLGKYPVSFETAERLSTHDLESILGFIFSAAMRLDCDKVASKTAQNCCHILAKKEAHPII